MSPEIKIPGVTSRQHDRIQNEDDTMRLLDIAKKTGDSVIKRVTLLRVEKLTEILPKTIRDAWKILRKNL